MQIKQLVEKAKNGDQKSFNLLVEYYEEHFANAVVKNNNDESLRQKAKEELPSLIKLYLKHNYVQPIHDYLNYYSKTYFTDKLRLSDTRDMDLNKLKEIYAKRLFHIFEKINKVLTEEELKLYTYKLISSTIDKFSDDREALATRLGVFFGKQKLSVNTQESLLIRYILQEGFNDNIIEFFYREYRFILNEYKKEISYVYLNGNFRNIIVDILSEISTNKVSIESTIRKKVHRIHIDYTKEITNVGLNVRTDNQRIEELYNSHISLKERVKDLYEGKVPKDKMIEIIDKNYDLYFNAYVNGVCSKPLSWYILTRFSEYFNKIKLPRQLSEEELAKKELIYSENEDCIDKKIRKTSLNHPYELVRNELMRCYDEAIDTYFRKESKTDFRIIVGYKLKQKLEELSGLYSDDNIINTSLSMKASILLNKIQNEEVANEIIDNLTDYYIFNKMSNEKPFELFIIDAIENFDMEEYLMIKDAKEHINLKVLNRSKK